MVILSLFPDFNVIVVLLPDFSAAALRALNWSALMLSLLGTEIVLSVPFLIFSTILSNSDKSALSSFAITSKFSFIRQDIF